MLKWNQSYAPIWFSRGWQITHICTWSPQCLFVLTRCFPLPIIFLWTISFSYIYIYIYICIYLSELPSSSFIIDFHYCQHIYNSSMPCIFQSLFAWLKSFGHQYCSHLLTTVVISSLHSFCQILMLLVACVPFHV